MEAHDYLYIIKGISNKFLGGRPFFLSLELSSLPPIILREKSMKAQIHFRNNSAYWGNFKLGTLHPDTLTFLLVPRSENNAFRLFGRGLGINQQLLNFLKEKGYKFIVIPFEDRLLKTTVTKWIKRGITSPYASSKIDRQCILSIDQINMSDEPFKMIIPDNQLLLWST